MKKLYLFAFLLFASLSVFGQKPTVGEHQTMNWDKSEMAASKTAAIDTIFTYINRASSATIYSSQDGGYVTGTGYFDNQGQLIPITDATGMHYDGIPNARVTEVLTWVAFAVVTGTSDTVRAAVYSVAPDTTPTAMLGFGRLATDQLSPSTNLVWSAIPITDGLAETNGAPFLLAFEYFGFDDTLGIVTSNPDSGDGLGEERFRQLTTQAFGGGWISGSGLWGGLDFDAFILPVVDDAPVGVDQYVNSKGLELHGNYPNPTSHTSNIRFGIDREQEIRVIVFDLSGREVLNTGWNNMASGEHTISVDLHDQAAGSYYYRIQTRETELVSKLNLVK